MSFFFCKSSVNKHLVNRNAQHLYQKLVLLLNVHERDYMELKTLQDAMLHFSEPGNAIAYMVRLRWPDGVIVCPSRGSKEVTWMPSRSLFQCKARHPKRQFSVKVGTIFEDSPLPLGKWLIVAWMLGNCRNGISSHEVARNQGVARGIEAATCKI